MFKKITVAFLFCLTGSIANAQSDKYFESAKPVICDDMRSMVGALIERWGEVPVWTALDAKDHSRYLLLINPKKGSWTLLQHTPEIACVLGVGFESNLATDSKNSM